MSGKKKCKVCGAPAEWEWDSEFYCECCLCTELEVQWNEAFTRMLTMDGGAQRTLRLELKDPEGKTLYHRELAKYGASARFSF